MRMIWLYETQQTLLRNLMKSIKVVSSYSDAKGQLPNPLKCVEYDFQLRTTNANCVSSTSSMETSSMLSVSSFKYLGIMISRDLI